MASEDDETPEQGDRIEAKLDRVLENQARILECIQHINAGQNTVVTRVNAIYRRGTIPRKKT